MKPDYSKQPIHVAYPTRLSLFVALAWNIRCLPALAIYANGDWRAIYPELQGVRR